MAQLLRQAKYGISGLSHVLGYGNSTTVRPLLLSQPVPLKRALAAGASIVHSEYSMARHTRVKMLKKSVSGKQERLWRDSGLYAPIAFASHKDNEKIALEARVLQEQLPAPDLPVCIKWVTANMKDILPRVHRVKPVPWEEYLRRVGSSPSVKKRLSEARARLIAEGITSESTLTKEQIHQFTKRSSFVKVENLSYHSPLGLKLKAPRLIQGVASLEFLVLVGPSIMALQDLVCRRWRPGKSNLVFTSGISAEAAAEHVASISGQSGFDDIASFDLDQTRPWGLAFVQWCRKWGFGEAALALMLANVDTHGTTHHGWKYKCKGTRKSGDPYTSLFNTMINIFTHLWIYCTETGKSVQEASESFVMVAQGDDNAFTHASLVAPIPWRQRMRRLGFDSEATYVQTMEEMEFCSMRMYRTREGWVFGPKPGRVMSRFGYAINRPPNVTPEGYARGVAMGMVKQSHFIPILRAFFSDVLARTSHVKDSEVYIGRVFDGHQLKVRRKHTEDIGPMYNLNTNYYWCYESQRRFENHLRDNGIGSEWPAWIQQQVFDRDTDGLKLTYAGA